VTIAFVRHGQTDWNARHLLQGSNREIDLTEKGIGQVRKAADGLLRAGYAFDRVYVSPYRRARHTAEIICSYLGGKPVVDDRVREMDFGEYEGTPYLEGGYADDNIRAAFESPCDYRPHGGESYESVLNRIRDFLNDELRPLEGTCDRVLVVAHGGVLHAVVTILLGLGVDRFWEGRQSNCCVHLATLENGLFTLTARNLTF